jgi:hypothetical protein
MTEERKDNETRSQPNPEVLSSAVIRWPPEEIAHKRTIEHIEETPDRVTFQSIILVLKAATPKAFQERHNDGLINCSDEKQDCHSLRATSISHQETEQQNKPQDELASQTPNLDNSLLYEGFIVFSKLFLL